MCVCEINVLPNNKMKIYHPVVMKCEVIFFWVTHICVFQLLFYFVLLVHKLLHFMNQIDFKKVNTFWKNKVFNFLPHIHCLNFANVMNATLNDFLNVSSGHSTRM